MIRRRAPNGPKQRRARSAAPAVRFSALLLAGAVLAGCANWAQNRAGPEGTGFNPGENTISRDNVSTLELAWSKPVGWTVPPGAQAAPIVRSGTDVVVASPGSSVVLNAETGALRLTIGRADDESVAVADGRIIIASARRYPDGHLRALDLATGAELWSQATGAADPTAPIVADGRLFVGMAVAVGTHSPDVQAFNVSDGKYLWTVGSDYGEAIGPAVGNGTVYFTQNRFNRTPMLSAFAPATGVLQWSVPEPKCSIRTSPVTAGGRVYVSGSTYDAASGADLWDWPVCPVTNLVTVSPNTVYVPYHPTATTTALSAFDAGTGAVRWSIPWGQDARGAPATPAVANEVLFAADGNRLVAYNAITGNPRWRSPAITGTFDQPIVSHGKVYAVATDGSAYAFGLP